MPVLFGWLTVWMPLTLLQARAAEQMSLKSRCENRWAEWNVGRLPFEMSNAAHRPFHTHYKLM
jgi:hypothetical protein